ncbi:MAG: hypothetical protein KatS3mg068_1666 [Candidatus Sericytochromatia bacterium]|nr:MAG: hypothetical protein KatS3mg068_1666 [Candidatus Sericytochromatia bacterium]
MFQKDKELKSTLTYISNLISISANLIFNQLNFEKARKYVDEALELIEDHNFTDAFYLKALIEHNTNNYQKAIDLYIKLINLFRSSNFDKESSYGLSSKGKTLYPFTVIQLYKLYMTLNKESLALNVLLGNENNYYLVNMYVIKHFLLKRDLKNSANAYFRNILISQKNKDLLYKLLSENKYKQAIYQMINELLNTKEVFSDDDKEELQKLLQSII